MKLDLDPKIAAYVDSFTATCIKFIHLPPPATHKDVAVADFITSLVQIHGPLVKKVAANIVQYSSSGIDSHRLTALQDKQNVNIVELKNSDTEFTIPSYLNLVSSKLFPTVMLKPESLPMMNTLVRGLRKAKGIMINTFWELESHVISSLSYGNVPPICPMGPILDLDNESEVHQSSDIMI
ncbi:anthocyanidin 3-O-glucosyltransferase 6-like [Gossypium hirsutum]|uniref:Anthocyanidin 3-O-glucosyltransferase 6-like n=1 Tax=Gossypium hirsutum TaxID=3635 RepID=A0ABM2Z8Y4_GOSHI|nr:anthocyanidin 3-O-glucosyltransferase 6-like [Gossypium hirsutum]